MKLTAIRDLQEAYYKDFGERITEDQATQLGIKLIRLMAIVCRPNNKKYSNN